MSLDCRLFVVHRFRSGIKELDMILQNLVGTAFDTVVTVEQGVEVLDIFMHFAAREVSRSCQ